MGICIAAIAGWAILGPDADALLRIETACLNRAGGAPLISPCVRTDQTRGVVLLKDRKGSHHFLLLPTAQIAGIESRILVDQVKPNYFGIAWDSRSILSTGRELPISDENILLAVNSRTGRTQNQMHIHISCVKPSVRAHLDEIDAMITDAWRPVTGGLAGHHYWGRRVTETQFREQGAFRLLAFGLPQAAEDMGRFSVAMTISRHGDIILLATARDLLDFNLASAEELQEQSCSMAQ